ncbi:MAG: hypothetical protein ACLR52_00565 [Veillonella atypica]
MTKQEAMERFSSGTVQQSLEIHRGIQWAGRIIGLLVALIVKYMPLIGLSVYGIAVVTRNIVDPS